MIRLKADSDYSYKNMKIKFHRTIISSVYLYGCETLSLTLQEEHRPRVLRIMCGPKRDEMKGEWRRLHDDDEIYDL